MSRFARGFRFNRQAARLHCPHFKTGVRSTWRSNFLRAGPGLALWCAAALPTQAAVVFGSAEVSVLAAAILPNGDGSGQGEQIEFSSQPRTLVAEANASALADGDDGAIAGANIGALADFNFDGSTGILSAGFSNVVAGTPGSSLAIAEVRYAYRYRFDVTTLSRFLGDWTVSFPQDVTIALEGPSDLSGPLPGAFGHHSALLPAGSYELSFSALGTLSAFFAQTGYAVFTIGGSTRTRGFDIYSFQIIDAPVSSVPEPASWALAALAIGACCIGARRPTGLSPARLQ